MTKQFIISTVHKHIQWLMVVKAFVDAPTGHRCATVVTSEAI